MVDSFYNIAAILNMLSRFYRKEDTYYGKVVLFYCYVVCRKSVRLHEKYDYPYNKEKNDAP